VSVIILYTFFLLVRFIYMIDTTYTPMTIAQIEAEYDEKLFARLGENGPFRGKILSPLFSNLYEQKVVYREKMRIFILRMEEMTADERGFRATVRRSAVLYTGGYINPRLEHWWVSSSWDRLLLSYRHDCLYAPSAGWTMWPDPNLVRKTEELYLQGEMERLLSCFFNDML